MEEARKNLFLRSLVHLLPQIEHMSDAGDADAIDDCSDWPPKGLGRFVPMPLTRRKEEQKKMDPVWRHFCEDAVLCCA